MAEILIGTSGWHYGHWMGPFYPHRLARDQLLRHYSRSFSTVELNSTFYRLPRPEIIDVWREQTPDRFIFACKASRFITHMKKLRDPHRSIEPFLAVVSRLGRKLGPILFQLPPNLRNDATRLSEFLDALPACHRYAFEFCDETWWQKNTYELLSQHKAACCICELDVVPPHFEGTADFAYIRLHGPFDRYRGSYSEKALRSWARHILARCDNGQDVYCFFDNDEKAYAPMNAMQLKELVSRRGAM